jgi:sugar lactone lactonase YvrE
MHAFHFWAVLATIAVLAPVCGGDETPAEVPFDIAAVGVPQLVGSHFGFTEGPVWNSAEGVLLFSDIPGDTTYKLTPPAALEIFRRPSRQANGLAFDPEGRLLSAEHESRRVTRRLPDGTVEVIAEALQGRRLNSPNDVAVRSDGTIYFTDPTYGLRGRPADLDFMGIYRVTPPGAVIREADDPRFPNGVVLSPDQTRLYVSLTGADRIDVFDVSQDGSLSGRRDFAPVGSPDGMSVDARGNIYVAAKPGVVVFSPRGAVLGIIEITPKPTNCAFGGKDGKTLYVTARNSLFAVRVPVRGAGFPRSPDAQVRRAS